MNETRHLPAFGAPRLAGLAFCVLAASGCDLSGNVWQVKKTRILSTTRDAVVDPARRQVDSLIITKDGALRVDVTSQICTYTPTQHLELVEERPASPLATFPGVGMGLSGAGIFFGGIFWAVGATSNKPEGGSFATVGGAVTLTSVAVLALSIASFVRSRSLTRTRLADKVDDSHSTLERCEATEMFQVPEELTVSTPWRTMVTARRTENGRYVSQPIDWSGAGGTLDERAVRGPWIVTVDGHVLSHSNLDERSVERALSAASAGAR